jgi:hypothetical protein
MKNRDYTLRGGKDASIMNKRQMMGETQHSGANAHVKAEQAAVKSMGGKNPDMDERFMKFNANMTNNGYHAQEFGKKLTSDMDKTAYPFRQDCDSSQD